MTRFAIGALGALVIALSSACSHTRCAPGEVPNDELQACVLPPACDGGTVNDRNECVLSQATTSGAGAGGLGGAGGVLVGDGQSEDAGVSSMSEAEPGVAGSSGGAAHSGQPGDAGKAPEGMAGSGGGDAGAAPAAQRCGDGIVSSGEVCDGNCPTQCEKNANQCIVAKLEGDAKACDVVCVPLEITECIKADGCCPMGCTFATDDDCSRSCGDGVFSAPEEKCEAGTDHPCPTTKDCDDGNPCTADTVTGSAEQCSAECSHMPITTPARGDSCCPPGANIGNDSDCEAACGDGVVSDGEACDTKLAGSCPSASMCERMGSGCMRGKLSGTGCNARCEMEMVTARMGGDGCCPPGANIGNDSDCEATCGDGVVSDGEACDTRLSGSCPSASTCERMGSGCMRGRLSGSGCSARCETQTITERRDDDQCCPSGANAGNDNDCMPMCGDGVVSSGEACDTRVSGSCPSASTCEAMGSGCMRGRLSGSGCSARCETQTITERRNDDKCCPDGASVANDNDCPAVCGDGIVSRGELCDGEASCAQIAKMLCDDGNSCTDDTLESGSTPCTPSTTCRHTPSQTPECDPDPWD